MIRQKVKFSELLGRTLSSIQGAEKGSQEIVFRTTDPLEFRLLHEQECCEEVLVEDVCGDVTDLVGTPILLSEEVTSLGQPSDSRPTEKRLSDSQTWTFYKLATIKGSLTIRWFASSNGYYSESVDFMEYREE